MFSLVLAAQIAAGTYTYAVSENGAKVGTSQITVKASGGGTEIDERLSGAVSNQAVGGTATLLLGSDLGPTSYQATGTVGGTALKASASVSNNTATISSTQSGDQTFHLPAPATHFVFIDLGSLAGLVALPAQETQWNDATVLAVVPSFGMSLELEPNGATATAPASVPPSDALLSVGGHQPFDVWYNPTTFVPDEIDIPSQGLAVTRLR